MSGYRQPDFDLDAGGDSALPLRPLNKWQRTGVAMMVVGSLGMVAAFAIRLGWHQLTRDDWIWLATALVILGSVLVGSRRRPADFTPATNRKRTAVIAAGMMLCGAALITILVLKGA